MLRRVVLLGVPLLVLVAVAAPATSVPVTTLVRTIQDVDGDDRLEFAPGEDYAVIGADEDFRPPRASILNFLQLSDFQMVDEESPARVEFLDQSQRGPFTPFSAAYRPQESLTTQVTEAMVRAARNTVSPITGERLDLAILTGDNADSQQFNETRWFIDILDGTARGPAGQTETFTVTDPFTLVAHQVTLEVGPADKIDPNSGIEGICDSTPRSVYDGVRNQGVTGSPDLGYYEPNRSGTDSDGDGYSPNPAQNQAETGRRVTVRDFPGLFEAANRPFEAIGLDMPWFSAFGNHDALVQGNSHEAYFGPNGPASEAWTMPFNILFHQIATGCVKPSNVDAGQIFREPGDPDTDPQTVVVPPDPRRCFLTKDTPPLPAPAPASPCNTTSWIQEHFDTTGTPVGHGFQFRPPQAITNHDGYYAFTPVPGLKFVVLDTVTDECGPPFAGFCSEGSVDDVQFDWLQSEIEASAGAGEYVMVFSHHTLRTTRWPTADGTEEPAHYGQVVDPRGELNPQNPTGEKTLAQLYCENPNVIAHIAGHEHANYTHHYACNGTTQSGLALGPSSAVGGFWHVSTAAHIDWPQQARMIELIDNGDGTMSLVLTILDHAGPPNPGNPKALKPGRGQSGEEVLKLASIAREIAYNDYQGSRGARGELPTDRNVIIVLERPWPYPTDDNGEESGGLSLLP